MRKKIKEQKRFKIGACLGVFICILLMYITIYVITPDFVANNLSPDGILSQKTIVRINFFRLLSIMGSIIVALYIIVIHIIKHNIFIGKN